MRTKDRPLLLGRALESVAKQTDNDWVLSLVNDGGNPAELERIVSKQPSLSPDRLQITHHASSKGMEAASNAAIGAVDSEFVVVHDDDDSWHPQFLKLSVSALTDKGAMGVVANSQRVIETVEGDRVIEQQRLNWHLDHVPLTLWNLCGGNLFSPISFLYRRSVFETIGMYDESLSVLGDWEFNLRFARKFDILRLTEALAYHHVRTEAPNASYYSTVTHQKAAHAEHMARIQNNLLRADLDENKIGLGLLVALAQGTQMSQEVDSTIVESYEILSRFNQLKASLSDFGRRNFLIRPIAKRLNRKPEK